jgi:hypothetical protein
MLAEMIQKLLENKKFVFLATADLTGRPNVAPKFLVKLERHDLYLVDYVLGTTWENINVNAKAAISFLDSETLRGYLLRGTARALLAGKEFDEIIREFQDKQLSLIAERVAEGVSRAKKHKDFGIALPEKGGVIKFHIDEFVEIGSSGKLKAEKI